MVKAAVLESGPPPVLPICLLASILDGWKMLSPERMRTFLDCYNEKDANADTLNRKMRDPIWKDEKSVVPQPCLL